MKRVISALLCAAAFVVTVRAAEARPHHRHHNRDHHLVSQEFKHHRVIRYRGMTLTRVPARQFERQNESFLGGFQHGFQQGFAGNSLVSRARQFIGETASQVGVRTTLWCSAFLRKITGAQDVDDRALSWERHQRIAPQVGAVVTMGRRGGGHVGVVSGFTAKGDPIVISGNHGGRVREAVYSRSRIRAWVSPT